MWQSKPLTLKPEWFENGFNSELKTAINTAIMPGNVATPGEKQPAAATDAMRDFSQLIKPCEVVAITPWQNGSAAGNKQNMNWFLSAPDAQAALANQVANFSWQGAVCFIVLADNADLLEYELQTLFDVFPLADVHQALSQIKALAKHDKEKVFTPGILVDQRKQFNFDGLGFEFSQAKQNLAQAKAVASDESPAAMLTSFKAKRASRLTDIQTQLASHASQGGAIKYVLNLTGHDLVDELNKTTAPNDHAPFCCLFAIGGSNDQLTPLREALAL